MEIKKIAIIGAGAMGAAYAAMFSDAGVFSLFFVARGKRFKRLTKGALTVNKKQYTIAVLSPDDNPAPADLVIVALKHHHLKDALEDIKPFVGKETLILSVMNGLESEELIGSVCGMDRMVQAIAVGIDAVKKDTLFTYASPGRIIFGNLPGTDDTRRLERIKTALTKAAIPNEITKDMMRVMWWKFMINVGINQASAVLKAPYGVFQKSQDARELMKRLMTEVLALAEKAHVNLTVKDLDEWTAILATLSPMGKTSMLQDIEAKRKTEVEIFSGKVTALGREYQVPTPVNETVLTILKALEDKNAYS